MYRDLWGTYPLHAVSEAMNSLDQLDWSGTSTPGVWVHTPAFIMNPFQAMLSSRLLEHNLLSVPSTTVSTAGELRKKLPASIPVALHIHWTHRCCTASLTRVRHAKRCRRTSRVCSR